MSSLINASTGAGGGIVSTADASGILELQSGGVTALTINDSQNVGIGTGAPSAKLSVAGNITQNAILASWNTPISVFQCNLASFWNNGPTTVIGHNVLYGASYATSRIGAGHAAVIGLSMDGLGSIDFNTYGVAGAAGSEAIANIAMRIDSAGNLLINTASNGTSTGGKVVLYSDLGMVVKATLAASYNPHVFYSAANALAGYINCNGTTTTYTSISDERLKTNIVNASSALDSVNAIKVRSFDFISDNSHVDYGYIAQELLEVVPEAVSVPTDDTQMMGVDFGKLTPRLVKAIQELKAIIDTQQARITALEAK